MKTPSHSIVLLLLLTLISVSARAQTTTLGLDSEYLGSTLDRTKPVTFYQSGELESATLKLDYQVGGMIFEAGKTISFHPKGNVRDGYLKSEYKVKDITFMKGLIKFHQNGTVAEGEVQLNSFDLNLIIPVNATLKFTESGKISLITAPITYQMRILGMTLRGGIVGTTVRYIETENAYKIYEGATGMPQLIGSLVTQRDRFGLPLKVLSVVVPPDANFILYKNYRTATDPLMYDSRWYYPATFTINNYNFGNAPFLYIRNNRLVGVKVSQTVVVDTYNYAPGEVVLLDDVGKVIPTQHINP